MSSYTALAWPFLSRLDPERAHALVLRLLAVLHGTPGALSLVERLCAVRDPRLAVEAFGLRFPNPVGLAAGLDKDAWAPAAFAALGFGAVEVGTITPLGQPGNPRPRLFRLPEEQALINRLGFPNQGASRARARLLRLPRPPASQTVVPLVSPSSLGRDRLWNLRLGPRLPGGAVLGVNLGKNAQTPLADAARDYVAALEALHDLADYAVINVSSPNTRGLRSLQERRALEALLGAVIARRESIALWRDEGRRTKDESALPSSVFRPSSNHRLPVLVKVSPDLDWHQLGAVVEAVRATGADGIVATNTTLSREGVTSPRRSEAGGLSGAPLRARSTEIVRWIARETGGALPIVGAGGIAHPDHALEKLDAGATLVQVYTGLVYQGPTLPARICRALLARRRLSA